MKKLVLFFVSLLSLLLLPINAKSYSPYDIISKGGVEIPFSEYKTKVDKKDLSHQEGTPPITATTLKESDIADFTPSKLKPEKIYDKNTFLPLKNDYSNTIKPFAVIGGDGRKKVSNTLVSPYNKIAYFYGENSKYGYSCTANVIAKNKILTNAHCVYDSDRKEYIKYGFAIPGMKDSHYSLGAYEVEDYLIPGGYIKEGKSIYDYAIIKLKSTPGYNIADKTGSFGISQVSKLKGSTISITGYPGDLNTKEGKISQYTMSGKVTSESSDLAFYKIDTAGGQSGSAMLNTKNRIVGVHNAAYSSGENGGRKMTSAVMTFVSYGKGW